MSITLPVGGIADVSTKLLTPELPWMPVNWSMDAASLCTKECIMPSEIMIVVLSL